ncbi:hypothetical protein HPB52_017804 [Rhipicephalus sanguineus]|uniref:Uncharacterized protein n=1 Tax=Rhipicephalus sanguineus TaxID=34632 RepID=A0A9D4Q7E5_RHISA|nr:hypothetical protein HPB52_017804 [Rhipicephalus sanguineus]
MALHLESSFEKTRRTTQKGSVHAREEASSGLDQFRLSSGHSGSRHYNDNRKDTKWSPAVRNESEADRAQMKDFAQQQAIPPPYPSPDLVGGGAPFTARKHPSGHAITTIVRAAISRHLSPVSPELAPCSPFITLEERTNQFFTAAGRHPAGSREISDAKRKSEATVLRRCRGVSS